MALKQIFVQNLKEFRKKEGLSQMKLAEYCGMYCTQLYRGN